MHWWLWLISAVVVANVAVPAVFATSGRRTSARSGAAGPGPAWWAPPAGPTHRGPVAVLAGSRPAPASDPAGRRLVGAPATAPNGTRRSDWSSWGTTATGRVR